MTRRNPWLISVVAATLMVSCASGTPTTSSQKASEPEQSQTEADREGTDRVEPDAAEGFEDKAVEAAEMNGDRAEPEPTVRKELAPGVIGPSTEPDAAAAVIQALISQAKQDEESEPVVTVAMKSTLDYGCPCPTWTFAPMHNGPDHGYPFAMVLPADSLEMDPTDHASPAGVYRMRGHFTGRTPTGLEWVKGRGGEPPNFPAEGNARETYWRETRGPEFIVHDWCFVSTEDEAELYADELQRLRSARVPFCADDDEMPRSNASKPDEANSDDKPKLSSEPPIVRGALAKDVIRKVIGQHRAEIRYCYEKGLLDDPEIEGLVTVNFTIAKTGEVIAAKIKDSKMNDASVESCMIDAIKKWKFPEPEGGGIVIVNYPFNFTSK